MARQYIEELAGEDVVDHYVDYLTNTTSPLTVEEKFHEITLEIQNKLLGKPLAATLCGKVSQHATKHRDAALKCAGVDISNVLGILSDTNMDTNPHTEIYAKALVYHAILLGNAGFAISEAAQARR